MLERPRRALLKALFLEIPNLTSKMPIFAPYTDFRPFYVDDSEPNRKSVKIGGAPQNREKSLFFFRECPKNTRIHRFSPMADMPDPSVKYATPPLKPKIAYISKNSKKCSSFAPDAPIWLKMVQDYLIGPKTTLNNEK